MRVQLISALADIKTPLILAGFVVIALFGLFRALANNHRLPPAVQGPVLGKVLDYAFILALVAVVLGFLGYIADSLKDEAVTLFGKVHQEANNQIGVPGAYAYLEADKTLASLTDDNGEFAIQIPPEWVGRTARLWATVEGMQPTPAQPVILSVPLEKAYIGVPPVTTPTDTPGLGPDRLPTSPDGSLGRRPAVDGSSSSDPLAPVASDYDARFAAIRTDELALARAGEQAFLNGDYEWAIRFLTQARTVQTSRVWQSAYPFLAAAYYKTGDPTRGRQVLAEMHAASRQPYGYLTNATPLGFLLRNLGTAQAALPDSQAWSDFDGAIDRVIQRKREAEASG